MSNQFIILELKYADTGEVFDELRLSPGSIAAWEAHARDEGCTPSELFSRNLEAMGRLIDELPEGQCNEAGLNALLASRAAAMGETWEPVQFQ